MNILNLLFDSILYSSGAASILALFIIPTRILLKDKIGIRLQYCVWILIFIRLAIPFPLQSSVSIFNIFNQTNGSKTTIYADYNNTMQFSRWKIVKPQSFIKNMNADKTRLTANQAPILSNSKKIIIGIWFLIFLVLSAKSIVTTLHFLIKIKALTPCENEFIRSILSMCKKSTGITIEIPIIFTELVKTPAIFGFIHPTLLLPIGIDIKYTSNEIRYIIYHELAHYRRKDLVITTIASFLNILHWFNPLIWYSLYQMRHDSELACDAYALSNIHPSEHNMYGQVIIKLLEEFINHKRIIGISEIINYKSQIKRRIKMISKFKMSSYKFSLVSIVIILVMSFTLLTDAKDNTLKNPKIQIVQALKADKLDVPIIQSPKSSIVSNNNNANSINKRSKNVVLSEIEYSKMTLKVVGGGQCSYEHWRDTKNLMEKFVTTDYNGNLFLVSILKDRGSKWIEVDYSDGKALNGRTWKMSTKVSNYNAKLLSVSIFDNDKEEYKKDTWKIYSSPINYKGKSVRKAITSLKHNKEDIVYLDVKSGLPVEWNTYQNKVMLFHREIEYKKYKDNPEVLFNCDDIHLTEIEDEENENAEVGLG